MVPPLGTLAPPGSAESQALGKQHGRDLAAYTPSLENMRELTSHTIYTRALVTDELVRERYEMSTGKNYEAQLQREQARGTRPILDQLRQLLGVLGEDDPRLRIGQDEGGVLGVRAGVDGGGCGAGAHDGQVGEHPLIAGSRGDPDALFGLDTEREQSGGQSFDLFLRFPPRFRYPVAVANVSERLGVRCRLHALE